MVDLHQRSIIGIATPPLSVEIQRTLHPTETDTYTFEAEAHHQWPAPSVPSTTHLVPQEGVIRIYWQYAIKTDLSNSNTQTGSLYYELLDEAGNLIYASTGVLDANSDPIVSPFVNSPWYYFEDTTKGLQLRVTNNTNEDVQIYANSAAGLAGNYTIGYTVVDHTPSVGGVPIPHSCPVDSFYEHGDIFSLRWDDPDLYVDQYTNAGVLIRSILIDTFTAEPRLIDVQVMEYIDTNDVGGHIVVLIDDLSNVGHTHPKLYRIDRQDYNTVTLVTDFGEDDDPVEAMAMGVSGDLYVYKTHGGYTDTLALGGPDWPHIQHLDADGNIINIIGNPDLLLSNTAGKPGTKSLLIQVSDRFFLWRTQLPIQGTDFIVGFDLNSFNWVNDVIGITLPIYHEDIDVNTIVITSDAEPIVVGPPNGGASSTLAVGILTGGNVNYDAPGTAEGLHASLDADGLHVWITADDGNLYKFLITDGTLVDTLSGFDGPFTVAKCAIEVDLFAEGYGWHLEHGEIQDIAGGGVIAEMIMLG